MLVEKSSEHNTGDYKLEYKEILNDAKKIRIEFLRTWLRKIKDRYYHRGH